MKSLLKKLTKRISDLLCPGYACAACGKERDPEGGGPLCGKCRDHLESVRYDGGIRCRYFPDEDIISAFRYTDPADKLLRDLKYRDKRYIAAVFAPYIAENIRLSGVKADAIVPVPLHKKRMRKRGYNQSLLLAEETSKLLGGSPPVRTDMLYRIRATKAQARLGEKERFGNVSGAFTAKESVSGLDILLMDDIITTGSTIKSAADALIAAGAKSVKAVSAARA